MKVILGSESFPPNVSGVATATKNIADNLCKNGHEAFVFTPGSFYGTKIDRNFSDYTVFRLKSFHNPFRKGYRVTFTNSKNLEKQVLAIKPDLIHLQDPAVIGRLLRDIGRKHQIPVIITNHFSLEYALSYLKFISPLIPFFKERLVQYLVDFYNQCDQIITPTETFRKQVQSWGVKVPVTAVSNGIQIENFTHHYEDKDLDDTRLKYHIPKNPFVLYLGRVDKDKRIDVLINAIPLVLKKINAHFVIAGSGDELPNVKKQVSDLKIDNSVTFLGFIDHNCDDFVKLYRASALFAIPSPIETQSLVTLEAMSSRRPIVAADAGALPELVHPGKNGYLSKTNDYQGLADDIIKILSEPKLAEKMGEESFKIARTHEMKKAFAHLLEVYKEVIERSKKN